ncbi:MAG TPA: hypothetical protein VKU87_03235 [Thermomicrobiaceae bacterium]|nr:hypothetical protein [Thermomicrobiaceae bacterium]
MSQTPYNNDPKQQPPSSTRGRPDSSEGSGGTTPDTHGSEDMNRRRALKLGAAGIIAAGALAFGGSRTEVAQAADGSPLTLGQENSASSDTLLKIDNADPNTSVQVDGLRVELKRGFSAIYGIAGSGTYGAVRAKNIGGGPGLEAESNDGPGVIATGGGNNSGIYATSGSGPGVQGVGNAAGAGILARNTQGGPALVVDGPSKFSGKAEFGGTVKFDGGPTTFSQPVEFQGGVQLSGLAGTATIPKGKTSIAVANPSITNQSVILLTPVGNPAAAPILLSTTFWYERKPGSGFIVHLSLPAKQNLEFAYFIAKM